MNLETVETWAARTFDCNGNPLCCCINHRPDLYNSTVTLTGATVCTAPPSPPVYPITVWPPR